MKIYIPTLGRLDKQATWESLPAALQADTYLVCPPEELDEHRGRDRQAVAHPAGCKGIANVRQWIVEEASTGSHTCMIDDDQRWKAREPGSPKLRRSSPTDVADMFRMWRALARAYAAVSVSPAAGNNRSYPKNLTSPGRMFNCYILNRKLLERHRIRFNEMQVMEDFNVTLQLLRRGLPNAIIQNYAWEHTSTQTSGGGCSTYRTLDVQAEAAKALARKHPRYVTVVEKEHSEAWGGARLDVRVQWKKALEEADLR